MGIRRVGLIAFIALSGCTKDPQSKPVESSAVQRNPIFEQKAEAQNVPENVIEYYVNEQGEIVPTLINGEEVSKDDWRSVVRIKVGNSGCSATVVGPKVVITAAHCGSNGATATFDLAGKSYSGKIERSSLYPGKDHDQAVIILDQPVPKEDVKVFASIGGNPVVGGKIYLLGYGCTQAGGGGGNDGKLRAGLATIKGFSGYGIISSEGAALCFGDSGGPAMVDSNKEKPILISTNSKGNIRDTNYTLSTVSNESKAFWSAMASKYSAVICGVNGTEEICGDVPNVSAP
jgi:hypothetical protein